MDIQNFIAEFKKTFVYDILSQTLTDEQLFEHAIDGDGVTWFKEQMRQMWDLWQAAKAQAVPEWFDYTKQSPQMDGNYQIFIKGEQITAKWVSRFGFADPIEGDVLRQELITHWAMQPQSPKAQEPAK